LAAGGELPWTAEEEEGLIARRADRIARVERAAEVRDLKECTGEEGAQVEVRVPVKPQGTGHLQEEECAEEVHGQEVLAQRQEVPSGVRKLARRAARAARKCAEGVECAWMEVRGPVKPRGTEHLQEEEAEEVPRGNSARCGMWSSWHVCRGVWG
jgi:hypothetical protein